MDREKAPQLEFREWLGDQMDRVGLLEQSEFAEFVGVAQSSISDWLRGQGLPRRESRQKLAHALRIPVSEVDRVVEASRQPTNLSASTLLELHATGGLVVGGRAHLSVKREPESVLQPVDVRYIPIIGTAAADTLRASWGHGDLYPVLRRDLTGINDPVLFVVSGDCMEPRINNGDLVVLDRMADPVEGDVVAIRMGDDITLKEYRDEGDEVVLRAVKAGYAPIRIKKSDQGASLVGVARAWFRSGKV